MCNITHFNHFIHRILCFCMIVYMVHISIIFSSNVNKLEKEYSYFISMDRVLHSIILILEYNICLGISYSYDITYMTRTFGLSINNSVSHNCQPR